MTGECGYREVNGGDQTEARVCGDEEAAGGCHALVMPIAGVNSGPCAHKTMTVSCPQGSDRDI